MGNLIKIFILLVFSQALESKETSDTASDVILRPQMRAESTDKGLYTIQTSELASFFENVVMFDSKDEYEKLPYVFGFEKDKNMAATGDIAYVLGFKGDDNVSAYTLLSNGQNFKDPQTGAMIGFKADVIGDAEVSQLGLPTTVLITSAKTSIDVGARMIPRIGLDLPESFDIKPPAKSVTGYILDTQNKNVGAGTYTVVSINLGQKDGVVPGTILNLMDMPQSRLDPYTNKKVDLPIAKFGEVIIYKVGEKFSLAVISYTTRPVVIKDKVVSTDQLQNS